MYKVLPKIPENLNILCKPLGLQTCAARCLLLYLPTVSQPTWVLISARVSEFWLFSLHHFHVCLLILKWCMLRSKEFGLNFAYSSTKLQLKTHWMIKEAFGEQALSQSRTFGWFKHFEDGREFVEDCKHCGRPSTCTTLEMIVKVILEDIRQIIYNVCNRTGLSYWLCQRILVNELNIELQKSLFISWTMTSETIRFRCALSCKKQLDMILTSCPGL